MSTKEYERKPMDEAIHPRVTELLSLPQPAQRTAPWYEIRKGMLTASDLAAALGVNPYEKPYNLLLKKCGLGPVFTGNACTDYGASLEDFVVEKFCSKFGWKHFDSGLLKHPSIDFLGGSPDGLLSSKDGSRFALLEIKCPLIKDIKDEVPPYYFPQIQLCMQICRAESCFFVQYRPESMWQREEFSVREVPRDDAWFEMILPVAEDFWKQVLYHRANGGSELIAIMESRKRKRKPPGIELTIGSSCLIDVQETDLKPYSDYPGRCLILDPENEIVGSRDACQISEQQSTVKVHRHASGIQFD
jgi:putative phage-type endonuclease